MKTAGMIVIGDEILSGRTQDKNIAHCAKKLGELGIEFKEVRVVPDDEDMIIEAVNTLRHKYNYVFTSGGIGATHDDITTQTIAKIFDDELVYNQEALDTLTRYYGDQFNDTRKKLALLPKRAKLIDNPVSKAPAFYMENVFVLAGVPSIFQAMFDQLIPCLESSQPIRSRSISCTVPENTMALEMEKIQLKNPHVKIGSYPFFRLGQVGVSLVVRGVDESLIDSAVEELVQMIKNFGGEPVID